MLHAETKLKKGRKRVSQIKHVFKSVLVTQAVFTCMFRAQNKN